ncbi:hypothetical protein ER13_08625 [Brevundimonas sp. EAKA]|nr:hypothetical protein ER13_08625 [Brevundimonas sp. EAKA]
MMAGAGAMTGLCHVRALSLKTDKPDEAASVRVQKRLSLNRHVTCKPPSERWSWRGKTFLIQFQCCLKGKMTIVP